MSLPVVIIDLTLRPKAFIDVLKTRASISGERFTLAKFSLAKFALAATTPIAEWRDPTLIVHGPAQIIVQSKKSSGILPLGISFHQVKGEGDANGTFNFPLSSRIMGMSSSHYFLGIDDMHYLHGPADSFVWKCCVVIQRKDGSIGIIDPHIENQD